MDPISGRSNAISRVLHYINEHRCDRLTLDDLARVACLSRFHFARAFRVSTGQSPMEYVLNARMEMAREMLAQSDQKIAVTAVSLGFFDQSHFTRTFRRLNGMSPRSFSKMQNQRAALSA